MQIWTLGKTLFQCSINCPFMMKERSSFQTIRTLRMMMKKLKLTLSLTGKQVSSSIANRWEIYYWNHCPRALARQILTSQNWGSKRLGIRRNVRFWATNSRCRKSTFQSRLSTSMVIVVYLRVVSHIQKMKICIAMRIRVEGAMNRLMKWL